MIPNLPIYVSVVFFLTTLLTLGLFYWVLVHSDLSKRTRHRVLGGMVAWLIIHMVVSLTGFYSDAIELQQPRIFLSIIPPIILMVGLFLTTSGRRFIDALSMKHLTWVHVVRIPVEFCLYWLALNKAIPDLLTFAGRNFDIVAGVSAPLIAVLCFKKGRVARTPLLIWNIAMLGLLLFVVVNGILSAPLPVQQFAFDQPNIALSYFPFVWLPGYIVPIAMFCHFVAIRKLLTSD